jgi:hypothetical protein
MLKIRGVTKIDYISNDRKSRKREHANLYMYTVRNMKSRLQKKTSASRRQYTKSWEGNYCLFNINIAKKIKFGCNIYFDMFIFADRIHVALILQTLHYR